MPESWLLWGSLLAGVLCFCAGWAVGQVGQREAVDAAAQRAWRAGYRAGVDVWKTPREAKVKERAERDQEAQAAGNRAGRRDKVVC